MRLMALALTLLGLGTKVSGDNFANFFKDEDCNEDGSIGFDIDKPGCFASDGAHSVYLPNNGNPFSFQHCLVMTYDSGECNCQNAGYDSGATGFCHKLSGRAKSYRFIRGYCDDDNC
ncbi:hypothetical protein I302_102700 [Kwoniella bestiolae CBS 10118]|uniref:Cyanovirin-N domain-containing protein n=1 Tax=Kwoniella bestiolae CBS 10118 TaxID=1296100 RepID=A0AAJ8M7P3_9TREE